MTLLLEKDATEDLLDRGYSRRQLGKVAALVGVGAAANQMLLAPAFAQQQAARGVKGAVRIGANECWTGPFQSGVDAIARAASFGNWYDPDNYKGDLVKTVASVEGIPEANVAIWPGSGGPLVSIVAAYCSPTKGLVTADPTFESAWRTADYLKAPLAKAPQAPGKGTDVKAMLAANPNAGLYYICTPNNPTGTVTPLADIQWLADNKPKDSILVVDEAYIHWYEGPNAAKLAGSRDDVLVLRTFSKLFGMAGMRLGLTIAGPALMEKMMRYDGGQVTAMLPMTAVACGTTSLTQAALIKSRRAEMVANREMAIAYLKKKGLKVIPGSHANMFMVDWGKPAKPMMEALLAQNVQIGRSWSIWPNVSRVSVGSAQEMDAFCKAVDKVLTA